MPHMFAFGSSNINREWANLRNRENFSAKAGNFLDPTVILKY